MSNLEELHKKIESLEAQLCHCKLLEQRRRDVDSFQERVIDNLEKRMVEHVDRLHLANRQLQTYQDRLGQFLSRFTDCAFIVSHAEPNEHSFAWVSAPSWLQDEDTPLLALLPASSRSRLKGAIEAGFGGQHQFIDLHPHDQQGNAHWWHGLLHAEWNPARTRVTGVLGVMQDITAMAEAQLSAEESLAKLSAILENTSDSVASVDSSTRFILFNRNFVELMRKITGCEPAVGMSPFELLDPAVHDAWRRRFDIALRGRAQAEELQVKTPQGLLWLATRLHPIRQGEQITGLTISITDTTSGHTAKQQQMEHERQMIHAEKLISLGTMVAGVAHEVNNPNHIIQMNARSLQHLWGRFAGVLSDQQLAPIADELGLDVPQLRRIISDTCGEIVENSRRITGIVAELKQYSRHSAVDDHEDFSLRQVMESAARLVRTPIRKATNHFQLELPESTLLVHGNAQQIEQVLINLILNACQWLPDVERAIAVRCESNKGEVTLLVEDEGPGVAPDVLPRLFEPFFTTRREQGGTGLGLAVSRRIVQRHGGSMEAVNRPEGGLCVRVRLPLVQKAATHA